MAVPHPVMPPIDIAARRARLPPRLLPVLYFAAAHGALLWALAALALNPRAALGFFYHDRLIALVHLVTLGWISSSILGALFLVAPLALRTHLPAARIDYAIFGWFVLGAAGVVGHFWIGEFNGMAWSAAMALTGLLAFALRAAGPIRRARIPPAIRVHLLLAFANIVAAGTMGLLVAVDKVAHILPGYSLNNVLAHAHGAAIGWVLLMIVGVGYRLLPMVLPAAMPEGPGLWASAVLLEAGIVGVFAALVRRSAWLPAAACLVAAGLAAFLVRVAQMHRQRRSAPAALPRPDFAVWHARSSLLYLLAAAGMGLTLTWMPASETSLHLALVYGVAGLLGAFSQLIVGMTTRLLPMFAWMWAFANTGFTRDVTSPHRMGWHRLQGVVFVLWQIGVPLTAWGFARDAAAPTAAGGALLLAAVALATANSAHVLSFAWRTPAANRIAN